MGAAVDEQAQRYRRQHSRPPCLFKGCWAEASMPAQLCPGHYVQCQVGGYPAGGLDPLDKSWEQQPAGAALERTK